MRSVRSERLRTSRMQDMMSYSALRFSSFSFAACKPEMIKYASVQLKWLLTSHTHTHAHMHNMMSEGAFLLPHLLVSSVTYLNSDRASVLAHNTHTHAEHEAAEER
eukprot:1161047-Pelagomonas_calceolata.AAC.20